jgi:DNA-binding CsgD family transcriptional regulator
MPKGRHHGRGRRERPLTPLQMRILAACSKGEVTPKEIAEREQMRLDTVGRQFRRLERTGLLQIIRRERARGFLRNYYVATWRAIVADQEFQQMSPAQRQESSEGVLRKLIDSYSAAEAAGKLASRGNHAGWRLLWLDEQGWRELMDELIRLLELSLQVQDESMEKLCRSGGSPIQAILALAGFEDSAGGPFADAELGDFLEGCERALEAETRDTRTSSHLSWSPLLLDQQGWDTLTGELARLAARADELQAESQRRLGESGEAPIPTVLGLAGFEGVARNDAAGPCP